MTRYEENVDHDNMHFPDWLLFLRAWRVAFSRFKLWGATTLVLLLLSLPSFLQTSSAFRGMIGNRYPDAAESRALAVGFKPEATCRRGRERDACTTYEKQKTTRGGRFRIRLVRIFRLPPGDHGKMCQNKFCVFSPEQSVPKFL